ncbi:dolichol-phosphate mannosyltransferase, partial [Modestobacter sp. VKM Ac-2676]
RRARAAADDRVHVLHRAGKQGLGPAYVAGFRWAAEHGYAWWSRWTPTGRTLRSGCPPCWPPSPTPTWCSGRAGCRADGCRTGPRRRQAISRIGNRYTRWALRLPLADATGGFRAARADLLARLPFDQVASQGYCFQVDWAWRAVRAGARVAEVPITFTERTVGRSKMSGSIVGEALARVTWWGVLDRLADRLPGRVPRPVPARSRDGRTRALQ